MSHSSSAVNCRTTGSDHGTGEVKHSPTDMRGAGNGVNNEGFLVIDCSRHVNAGSEDGERDLSEVELLKSTVEEWLDRSPPSAPEGWELSARLKIIYAVQANWTDIPFTPDQFDAINRAFKLPSLDTHGWSARSGLLTRFIIDGTYGTYSKLTEEVIEANGVVRLVYLCKRPSVDGTITTVIRYDPALNFTVGYILSPGNPRIDTAMRQLPSQFLELCHPLIVPTWVYETELAESATKLAAIEDTLLEIEGEKHTRAASSTVSPSRELLRLQLQVNLILDQNLQRARLMGEFLEQQVDILEQRTLIAGQASLNSHTKGLRERLSLLKSSREHLAMFEGLRTRIRARSEAVSCTIDIELTFI